jgi:Bacterial Ig domain
MRSNSQQSFHFWLAAVFAPVVVATASCGKNEAKRPAAMQTRVTRALVNTPGTAIELTAQRMSTTLRDGTSVPMWGFCPTGGCTSTWAPGPTIVATAGSSLQINLSNALPVPTSLVVLGQLGGGLGAPSKMPSPPHPGQNFTTFPGNGQVNAGGGPAFVPPTQGPRVRSFGAEAPAATGGSNGTITLTWNNLQPGTYLYETGTMPSLEVPMGLYGVLVVTTAPTRTCSVTTTTSCSTAADCPTGESCNTSAPGTAYPGVNYDDEVSLLLSEIDPVQNASVDAAAQAGADVNLRFNDTACAPTCYPAAVNYAPTYFLINGKFFDPTAPMNTTFTVADTAPYASGNVLLRWLNAGSRTHVPSVVGASMSLVAEDGNRSPGNAKVQSEALLVAGKTLDVLVNPAATADGTHYAAATLPFFDRSLSLSTGNKPLGGMLGFVLVNHASAATTSTVVNGVTVVTPVAGAPGNLPAALTPTANPDTLMVPFNATAGGDVTANDFGVTSVVLGTGPSNGALALNADGTFTYTPNAGFSGDDQFTYLGNGQASLQATVTLTVAAQLTGPGNTPIAADDTYTSSVATRFVARRPGVLTNDSDPHGFPLTAGAATVVSGCTAVSLSGDGSFTATAPAGSTACVFTYVATNSQGVASAAATVTVNLGAPSNLAVSVTNAADGVALTDYRWTLQEDLTFKHDTSATPALNTRTVGTSFHRSHMTVVATGCVGAISCGSGQSVLDPTSGARVVTSDADALAKQTTPDQVVLDPAKHYYVSILPGNALSADGSNAIGGGEVKRLGAGWAPLNIKVESSPLPPAQMSIYLYEDDQPTNGQNEPVERPLGGFNVILNDPAGRTGDIAGQQTYDAFNMPLSNALLGRPGCPDELNAQTNGPGTSSSGHLVGVIYTCPNDPNEGTPAADPVKYALAGHALIKNLTPARYDVIAHPGAARAGEQWWQTETLEGTAAQDAFVGVNEPTYFQEFGPPGPHVTIGFVNPGHVASFAQANNLTGTHTITGKITNQHMSHPSNVTLYDSESYDLLSATTCQVVLNSQGGGGSAVASAQCQPDGTFTLTGVPAGDFDLAIFDQWLDQIIQNVAVTVPAATQTVSMGNIPVLSWFTQYDQNIFMDTNGNGKMDPDEQGIANVPLTVRFRDGSISNRTLTDSSGNGTLPELFPLFNWYVAEADTTRFKQTGVHIIVDSGGKPDTTGDGAGLWTSTYVRPRWSTAAKASPRRSPTACRALSASAAMSNGAAPTTSPAKTAASPVRWCTPRRARLMTCASTCRTSGRRWCPASPSTCTRRRRWPMAPRR